MSGGLNSIYSNLGYALHLHSEALYRLQEQASTGLRINRMSDDPLDAYRILGLATEKRSLNNFVDTIFDTSSNLEVSLTNIEEMIRTIAAKKADITAVSGIINPEHLSIASENINVALEHMVSLANERYGNNYLFGGSDTSTVPYAVQRTNGLITSVTYQGSYETRNVEVASGIEASGFHVGDEFFRVDNRSSPIFLGGTGAAVGSGTSSVKGDVWLSVTDAGGGNYTLSIDGGTTTVNTDGTDANLAVVNASGEILYVDTTGISSVGTEMVRVPGTYDAFNTLINIRDILNDTQDLGSDEAIRLIGYTTSSLEEVRSHLVGKSISIGSQIGFLEKLKNSVENVKFAMEVEKSNIEQADITQIAIDISRRELLYEMSLSVAGRMMSLTLLDFIR